MKILPPVIAALLVGAASVTAAPAAQNTASGNYRVDAAMTANGSLIQDGAAVFVLDAQGNVVARRHAVPAIFDLAPGTYTAALVYKNARGREPLRPGTDPGTNVVNLEAGEVVLQLVLPDATRSGVRELAWTVHRYRPGAKRGERVAKRAGARPRLTLDAGWYEVEARYRDAAGAQATRAHVIEVKPGRRQTYSIAVDRAE